MPRQACPVRFLIRRETAECRVWSGPARKSPSAPETLRLLSQLWVISTHRWRFSRSSASLVETRH